MFKVNKIMVIVFIAAVLNLLLGASSPAFAYIDPNTGNLIYQILLPIITVITTACLFFKNKIRRLYCLVKESLQSLKRKSKQS